MQRETDGHTTVYRLIMGAWGSQAVRTLAQLSVAEHLEDGPLRTDQLAERVSAEPAALHRLLRIGGAMGLLQYNDAEKTFATTPLLRVLHEDAPESLKNYAIAGMGPAFWSPAAYAPEAVTSGKNQAVEALGCSVFEYFEHHPEEAQVFTAAMADLSTPVIREAVSIIDVKEAELAIDVGGANGAFVIELVSRNPRLAGGVLDLAHVVPAVAEEAERRGLTQRVSAIEGNFFQHVPPADIYLLKFVLHDWSDESCTHLLDNIRRSMNPGARVFIVEMVAGSDTASLDAALMDMAMLFAFTGQERDIPQFESLLAGAGLRAVSVKALRGSYRLIEAVADHGRSSAPLRA
jgi:O-methyltransferase/methyltransferase family protein